MGGAIGALLSVLPQGTSKPCHRTNDRAPNIVCRSTGVAGSAARVLRFIKRQKSERAADVLPLAVLCRDQRWALTRSCAMRAQAPD